MLQSRFYHWVLALSVLAGALPSPGAPVLSIAHRGGALYAPENTIAAFTNSLAVTDLMETDVQITSDGHSARPGIAATFLQTNQWLHGAATFNGNAGSAGRASIYLNGALMDSHLGNDNTPGGGLTSNVKSGQVAAPRRAGRRAGVAPGVKPPEARRAGREPATSSAAGHCRHSCGR